MTFAWPYLLWLLLAPAAWLAWELSKQRQSKAVAHPQILRAEAGIHSLDISDSPFEVSSRSHSHLWLAAGLALAIVALARPQWGRIEEPVFDQSREIVIAIDLSRSMLTPDVKPTRLDRAKLLTESLLDRLAGERVGLVVFSGSAFLQSPLSADYEILREFLPSLGPDYLPEGGTDYGALIDTAAGAFTSGDPADRFLIVLSDGGATDEDWKSHIKRLTDQGIRVIGLGIGTSSGALIPDGAGGFVKDDTGAVVMSKLESDNLKELCAKTGGVYRDGSEWVDLAALIKSTVEAGRKGRFVEKNTIHYAERFQWALLPAFLCLLISYWREIPVRPKPRDVRLKNRRSPVSPVAAGLALALLVAAGGASLLALGATATVPPSALLGRIVGRLSGQETSSAPDWAEMARQTVTWGDDLQSNQQPVPAGPVRDGLAAVEAGSALDAKAADWSQLRGQLQALLRQPEDQKKSQPPKQQNQPKSNPQNGSPPPKQNQNNPSQEQKQEQKQGQPQNQNQPQKQNSQPAQPKQAFGDMKQSNEPPQGGTQQVGGSTEHLRDDPAQTDPALAVPLQKLDQVRNRDSPAELFRMFENNEPRPPLKKGKDW